MILNSTSNLWTRLAYHFDFEGFSLPTSFPTNATTSLWSSSSDDDDDDSSSGSSTTPVDRGYTKAAPRPLHHTQASSSQRQQQQLRRRRTNQSRCNNRQVHFRETENVSYPHPLWRDELRELWYRPTELRAFRSHTLTAAKQSRQHRCVDGHTWESLLRQLSLACRRQGLPPGFFSATEEALVRSLSADLMGLEKYVLEVVHKDKARKRQQQLAMMHELRQQQRRLMTGLDPDGNLEFIRCSCESVSATSKLLAHRIALIHEAAAV